MKALLVVLAVVASPANAGNMCPAMPKPAKEGDAWYIPEAAFTKEEADKATKELQILIEKGWAGRDFDVHNPMVRIKGYLYRSYLEQYKKDNGEDDKYVKEEFCKFIRTEAYVSH
ncbi:MAG: hypothetical protein ACO1PN_16660 [Betaproteobacteria bacterium]